MKRLLLLLSFCMFLLSCSHNHKVLIYVRDGSQSLSYMLDKEVSQMKKILNEAGYEVAIATLTGEAIKNDSVNLVPDLKLTDANIDDYAGLLLPCMAAGSAMSPEAIPVISVFVNRGMPIAAQTNAILLLAKAGGLNGRKYAFYNEDIRKSAAYPEFQKGIYSGHGVVRDGNIVTSAYCPFMSKSSPNQFHDGTAEMTKAFIAALEKKKD